MASCYSCGVTLPEQIGRSTSCPSCGKDVRVCLNCRFYAPGSHWDCRETIPEPVREKDRGNFCDYFAPAADRGGQGGKGSSANRVTRARSSFDNLFGNE